MIKAVVFDMFETLVTFFDSPIYKAAQISKDIGITEQKFREIWDVTDHDRTIGNKTLEEVIEESLRVNHRYSDELFQKVVKKRLESQKECFHHYHPQIIPMFEGLKNANVKIALVSNCYFEERDLIKDSILWDYFDVVCMSCDLGIKKPDRSIFENCINRLRVEPCECLYVGDGGSFELEAAEAIGMKAVQAAWYLKDGVNQPVGRKSNYLQLDSPLDVISTLEL